MGPNVTRRRQNNKNKPVVLAGETAQVSTKGETGLPETPLDDASEEGGAVDLSTASEDDDDASDASEASEASDDDASGENSESPVPEAEKKKQKRTLTVFEVQSMYGTGGVDAIKAFATKEKRAITIAPIEKALNALQLMFDDASAFNKKCAALQEFLLYLKAQPGTGKGKRASYTVGGPPSPFTVQRPVNKATKKRGKPCTVIPLKALQLKDSIEQVWVKFEGDEIRIRKDKNFG